MRLKTVLVSVLFSGVCLAQMAPPPPPSYPPQALDDLVARVALYPDPLLAQVLSAATFSDEIPDAARWADEHHYLTGDALAQAISADELPWDPSVQALLPFPSVLGNMASDMGWTNQLGNAVLAERDGVMDAVQRMRHRAMDYGYLRSGPRVIVSGGPYVTIMPVDAGLMYYPYYDPAIVFARPRPGFAIGGAINFGFGISIGAAYRPWGWGATRFDWASHGWYVHDQMWGRNWNNRASYVHPYPFQRYDRGPRPAVARPDAHRLVDRSPRERELDRSGARRVEEHRDNDRGNDRRDDHR